MDIKIDNAKLVVRWVFVFLTFTTANKERMAMKKQTDSPKVNKRGLNKNRPQPIKNPANHLFNQISLTNVLIL